MRYSVSVQMDESHVSVLYGFTSLHTIHRSYDCAFPITVADNAHDALGDLVKHIFVALNPSFAGSLPSRFAGLSGHNPSCRMLFRFFVGDQW